MKTKLYGWAHKTARKLLKRDNELPDTMKFVNFPASIFTDGIYKITGSGFVNEVTFDGEIRQADVYPVENLVPASTDFQPSFQSSPISFSTAKTLIEAMEKWKKFIAAARIPAGYRNEGTLYAGFIKETGEWCLPSWIWTNAAIVRWYCCNGEIEKAKDLCDRLVALQQSCGGWIVRNDYGKDGVSPELAPNDSCYLALSGCLELYTVIGEKKYLESAERCAAWVIETAREDGLVWFGYDMRKRAWVKDRNIVDTGFTAGLFARLYEITGRKEYRTFLKRFSSKYIDVFYIKSENCFSTAIDGNDKQYGGAFGRGQGWALEGLIPAYRVLRDEEIRTVIRDTIETLLRLQTADGAWAYNLMKPLMGEDCKGVPVIARCLLEWNDIEKDERLITAAQKALNWCVKHTASDSIAEGGIFSYTIEGAVVHHMYTNTAFTYGSSYSLEVAHKLKGY
jgi:rhamnogalacturonyl hydrolase YesR